MNTPLTAGAKVKSAISSSVNFAKWLIEFFGSIGNIYKNYLEHGVSWFFNHVIVKCTHNTPSEKLYPLTFLMSIFWLAVTTYVMSAVCQRWVAIIKGMGYISKLTIRLAFLIPLSCCRNSRRYGSNQSGCCHCWYHAVLYCIPQGLWFYGNQQLYWFPNPQYLRRTGSTVDYQGFYFRGWSLDPWVVYCIEGWFPSRFGIFVIDWHHINSCSHIQRGQGSSWTVIEGNDDDV